MSDRAELAARVAELRWYHRMALAPGIVTDGVSDPATQLDRLHLPADLTGRRVLDVGAWDGAWSFEAERRGAARVLATDSYSWNGGGWGTKAAFELAREALGSSVEDCTVDVMALDPDRVGTFDLVLLLGVLYHLRDPLGALARIHAVTAPGGTAVVETEVDLLLRRRPAAALYPGAELNGDPTNWWGPNLAAVAGALQAAGFDRVELAWHRPLHRRLAGWVTQPGGPARRSLLDCLERSRAVFHAHRRP